LSAVKVPLGAVVLSAVIVVLVVVYTPLAKSSLYNAKFHGQTSTNPAEFMRVPLDARVNDKSPLPSVGTAEYTLSSAYPLGIITKEALFNKSLIL